jgi:hypothetical protein
MVSLDHRCATNIWGNGGVRRHVTITTRTVAQNWWPSDSAPAKAKSPRYQWPILFKTNLLLRIFLSEEKTLGRKPCLVGVLNEMYSNRDQFSCCLLSVLVLEHLEQIVPLDT